MKEKILVVDLDGTLIRSDMLHETFWSALAADWKTPFKTLFALLRGKAQLKELLFHASEVDITSLPYNQTVIDYVDQFRKGGGHTALVTASSHKLAENISSYLNIFDEVHGSSESLNLKGSNKAIFLNSRFGSKQYDYIGDAVADIPVWQYADKAILVNASKTLSKATQNKNSNTEHLPSDKQASTSNHLKSLRPHQWLKNLLVFLPLLAAHQFSEATLFNSCLAFVAFSLIASSVYITNDLLDLNADRAHPRKCKRPFACGAIPIQHGLPMAILLLIAGFVIATTVSLNFVWVVLIYYLATSAYSLYLKRKAIVDICTLAGLYTLRVIAGGVANDIEVSFWLLSFSVFIFLSLATVKRQAELVDLNEQNLEKTAGRDYHTKDLPIITILALVSGFAAVLVFTLYINSSQITTIYPNQSALWMITAVLIYWLMRIVFVTHRGQMHDDPIVFAIKDRISQICFVLITTLIVLGSIQ